MLQRAAQLLGDGAAHYSAGLGKQAVHGQRAAVLHHHIGHAVYAQQSAGDLHAAAVTVGPVKAVERRLRTSMAPPIRSLFNGDGIFFRRRQGLRKRGGSLWAPSAACGR